MNPNRTVNKTRPQIREEATEWLVAFCEGEVDASGRESFDRWLRSSRENVQAYLQVSALWEAAGLLVENSQVDVGTLVQRALSESNVVTLSGHEMPSKTSPIARTNPRRRTASRPWAVAACLLLVTIIAGAMAWWQRPRTPLYETGAAEQRAVRLSDGSIIQLNARSQIELHFTTERRVVDLIQGQALFSVAKDPGRPFVVRSGATRVKAVGTQFDVYRKTSGTIITVVAGRVAIELEPLREIGPQTQANAARKAASPLLVSAGEQAVAVPHGLTRMYRTNVSAATAWTKGQLVFDSTPLRQVVEEFNRMGLRRLVVQDDSLLDLHISGVFSATDPSTLEEFLRQRLGITVTETADEVRIGSSAHR